MKTCSILILLNVSCNSFSAFNHVILGVNSRIKVNKFAHRFNLLYILRFLLLSPLQLTFKIFVNHYSNWTINTFGLSLPSDHILEVYIAYHLCTILKGRISSVVQNRIGFYYALYYNIDGKRH